MSCPNCSKDCHHSPQFKWNFWSRKKRQQQDGGESLQAIAKIALVGMPNVGKSVIFNQLTGAYATVSNYPGTTVEVARGRMSQRGAVIEVIDTPGMYSLLSITEEEKVARDLLLLEPIDLTIHVIDAKNVGRMLPLTLQLIETGLPLILAINMIDEAEKLGISVHLTPLEQELGIPAIVLAAAKGRGIQELRTRIEEYVSQSTRKASLSTTY